MSVSLPPDLEQFVQQELASGEYTSEEEILQEGLRLLQERKRRLEQLKSDIRTGLDQLNRGEGQPLNMEEIRQKVDRRIAQEKNH